MGKISLFILEIFRFLQNLIIPVIRLCFKVYYLKIDKLRPLPKCKSNLLLLPANILAKKIRNKEITSQELIQVFIDRIKEIQPLVNCVVQTRFEEALQEAKLVDQILSGSEIPEHYSEKNAPLLGVPFSCKECIAVKGMPNTSGLISRKNVKIDQDAVVVDFMKRSGAILTCVTNTSEACMWLESSNYITGTSRNPYNLSRIVGGSSGGEGSIVSSAGAVVGIGSDIGGSIRMPSFFNGVYGHKPSAKLINNNFQFPPAVEMQDYMLCTGPICRYASDLKLIMKIFMGEKYKDHAFNFEKYIDLKKLKYYFIKDLHGNALVSKPSKDTEGALNKAVDFIKTSLGLEVNEIKFRKFRSCFQMWSAMISNGIGASDSFSKLLTNNQGPINAYKELFKSIIGQQKTHTLPAISMAIIERFPTSNPKHHLDLLDQLRQEIQETIGEDGVILFPSFPVTAPYHYQPLLTNSLDFIYFGIINALGFPSTQIPLGLSEEGLPVGVQIIANHNQDHLTISLAEYFESNLIGWIPPF